MNNNTSGVAWFIKPTSDTLDYLKGLPVNRNGVDVMNLHF